MSTRRPDNVVNLGCLDPIKAPEGKGIGYYRCGKCAACTLLKSFCRSNMSFYEFEGETVYPLFTLLTYDNKHVPHVVVSYTRVDGGYYQVDVATEEDGEILFSRQLPLKQLIHLHKIAQNENIGIPVSPLDRESGVFILSRVKTDDLQLFFKRLRRTLVKKGQPSFRYAACSEYGPTTNRPHYHVLFFCKSPLQRALLQQYISKKWQYGNTNSKYYTGHGADYISSYINSVSLSSVLHTECNGMRPRFFHSVALGRKGCERHYGTLESIYREPGRFFDTHNTVVDGRYRELCPLYSYLSTLFPKCLRHDVISARERYENYASAFYFIERGTRTPSSLARQVMDVYVNPFRVPDDEYGRQLNLLFDNSASDLMEGYGYTFFDFTPDFLERLYRRIYTFCRVSFKTYYNLLRLYPGVSPYKSLTDYVTRVSEIYKLKDYHLLKSQLEKAESMSRHYPFKHVALNLYDNWLEYHGYSGESFRRHIVSKNPLMANYRNYCMQRQRESVKTKKIKDQTTTNFYKYNYGKCNVSR